MPERPPHIGIIACSAEGAALCYRSIVHESAPVWGQYVHPQISLHSQSFADYMRHIDAGNWDAVADLMADSAAKLESMGAEVLICPDNTIHQSFEAAAARTSVPWLHIAEVVASEATSRSLKKLLITGTKFLMEGPVYPDKLSRAGIEWVIPEANDRLTINKIIFDELVHGVLRNVSVGSFLDIIDEAARSGCDGVILGCTEIPLIISAENSRLPVLDSTTLLAQYALRFEPVYGEKKKSLGV